MPRRKKKPTLTVEAWPDMIVGHLYPAVITDCTVDKAPNRLRVTAENRDCHHEGRLHSVTLPLPVRPGNPTCRLFVACGLDANDVGTQITIDHVIGPTIGLRYRGRIDDGTEEFDFEPIPAPPAGNPADSRRDEPEPTIGKEDVRLT
jgi:hypothetical protein